MNEQHYFESYRKLRDDIDIQANRLEKIHKEHMECKKGCDSCCIDYSILPIEFFYILNALKKIKISLPDLNPGIKDKCTFLSGHSCTIYEHRPIICRTHGLPLIFMNDDNEWELSACQLNFAKFDFNEFSLENTYQQDLYNSKLFMLNKEYLNQLKKDQFGEFELLPLTTLKQFLFSCKS